VNTLGMKFVPVPITGGPTGGKRVLFSIWETRVRDYAAFRQALGQDWKPNSEVDQGPEHAVAHLRWEEAAGFCEWLTEHERKAGRIGVGEAYRLPSDHEWSCAVGIGDREDPARTPKEKDDGIADVFPWGGGWPPPNTAGNYWSEELRPLLAAGKMSWIKGELTGRRDGFATVAPVGSYAPSAHGLYDLGGNVTEWCEEWADTVKDKRVHRGRSWGVFTKSDMLASSRGGLNPTYLQVETGFRCVLAAISAPPKTALGGTSALPGETTATKDAPFVNTLGMKFVPVPITGGPTGGKRVLFSIWETRVQDFKTFAREAKLPFGTERSAEGPGPTHPVVTVTWDEAQAFCAWLTESERKAGKLGAGERYRLPSDHEWSCAVGIGEREDAALSPKEKSSKLLDVHPWGTAWPPPEQAGNFASEELRPLLAEGKHGYIKSVLPGYRDGHAELSPVGSYPANALGLHDLAGNVEEWCEDWLDSARDQKVDRGAGSWSSFDRGELRSARRGAMKSHGKVSNTGFRVVLAPIQSASGSAPGPPATVPSKPGRLEGTGTMANGKTLDLIKFDAYGDFVDVAGSSDFLVALRANGETVSSDGKADFTGIRKIARSFQGCHCFITDTGELRFHPSREMPLPSSLKGRKVVDAACGDQHAVALLEGGQAMVLGPRYEGAVNDMSKRDGLGTPRWPQPEAAALQNVKGVAVTYTHAATLHDDGTVSVWGWEGPVKWQPEAKMKPIRQISSHHDSLHLLDEAGQVWSFPLPRSAHPEQPVGFNGTVKPLGTAAVRLRDHLWLGADGAWHGVAADLPVQKLLERTDLQPETNFALLSSTANAIPYGYVLWIEPVVPAGAAVSPAPSLPVSPSSPTLPAFTDREAAEWVLGLGNDSCNVKVLKAGKLIEVRKLADLPAEPWVIQELRVNLSANNQPELWGKVTDAQVLRLAGLKALKIVEIRGNVAGASLKVMAHHPGLESLLFEGLNLKAEDLDHLRTSSLRTLWLPMLQVADPESLAVLATMPNLRQLTINESFGPAIAAALPKLPKVETLRANMSANTTDDVLPLLVERLPQLTVLQLLGAKKLKGTTLGSLLALKSLTNLGLTDAAVNDAALAQIAGMPQLLTLDLGQTRITDACLPTLKSLPKLESLSIYQTELTDAALLELASIRTLKKLDVTTTNPDTKRTSGFTAGGIAAFQKLRPDVQLVK
jgi:formylglycine-generating enzyme required for sulfatase activity